MTEKINKTKNKEIENLFITVFGSYYIQQQTLLLIEACRAPYSSPLFSFLNCNRRGGYLEVPFCTVLVIAIPRSFKVIIDFQQTNKLLRNR